MKKERKKTYQFVILKNDCTFAIQVEVFSFYYKDVTVLGFPSLLQ